MAKPAVPPPYGAEDQVLKTIPAIITPELLHSMALMGHGDILAIVDRNYPSHAGSQRVHHLAGVDAASAADAILTLFPVDDFTLPAAYRMTPDGQPDAFYPAHESFRQSLRRHEGREVDVEGVQRKAHPVLHDGRGRFRRRADHRRQTILVLPGCQRSHRRLSHDQASIHSC